MGSFVAGASEQRIVHCTSVKLAHVRIRAHCNAAIPSPAVQREFTTNEKGSRISGSLEAKRKLQLEGECSSQPDLARDLPEVRPTVV